MSRGRLGWPVAFLLAYAVMAAPASAVSDDIADGRWEQRRPSPCTVKGTAGNDRLFGTKRSDVICGRGGDDKLFGRGGGDELRGGAGNDLMDGGRGPDQLLGEDGDDSLQGGGGRDFLDAAGGSDTLEAGAGADTLSGGEDLDQIGGGEGVDEVSGGAGDDSIDAGSGSDSVDGEDGTDEIVGGSGDDELNGGAGNDHLLGGEDDDRLVGGDGADDLGGEGGADSISGEGGDDAIDAGDDDDTVDSGEGEDSIHGGSGDDSLSASTGDDGIFGGDGDDLLFGEEGDDRLDGESGADRLDAGPGLNVCVPGGPSDVLEDNCVDKTPPTITDIEVNPTEVDTSLEPKQVLLRVRGDDDLSGLASAKLLFVRPGEQYASTWSLQPYRGADPDLQGTLEGHIYIGQLTGSGDWDLVGAAAKDRAGNEVEIQRDALDAIGAPTSFHQSGGLDETGPELLDVSVTPRSIDTSGGTARVTVEMELADAEAGVDQASADFRMQENLSVSADAHLVSGDRQHGVWRATYDVPRWTRTGDIPLELQVFDRANNATIVDAGSIAQLGEGDTTPPSLADMKITPRVFSTVGSDQTVKLRFRIQDGQAGVTFGGTGSVMIMLQGPGGFPGFAFIGASPEGGGTPGDGWWAAEYVVPRYSAAATWTVSNVYLTDNAGNMATLRTSDLNALGFPTTFSNQPG